MRMQRDEQNEYLFGRGCVAGAEMKKVQSILVALEREDKPKDTVAKAVAVARYFGARLELFLCNAEYAYVQRHQYEGGALRAARDECLAQSRLYLEQLWASLAVHDVTVTMDAACESPGYEGIVHKVRHAAPDLLIRGMGERGSAGRALDASDWELVRTCPVPLLLTRGKPWKTRPAVAAAIDIGTEESPAIARSILRAANRFAVDCAGCLDLIYAHRLEPATPETIESDRAALAERAREAEVSGAMFAVIGGEPAAAIPRFVARHGYDLLVLGALTHRKAPTALVGSLTGRLIETLDCDILLVKPPFYRSPVR
jgi:universal stress protein E